MKIAICGSMVFTDKMLEVKKQLETIGHTVLISRFATKYAGKPKHEIEKLTLHDKHNNDALTEFWEQIKQSDAILVLNYDRKGIYGYIGGNTLMEIGFAHVLHKKIYLFYEIPEIRFYKDEIQATKPIILNGDLTKIH